MRKILVLLFILITFSAVAQQDAILNQYMFNKTLINPAYTGTQKSISMVAVHREQWVAMPGAPQTSSFSIHSPLQYYNMGIGGYIMRDALGPIEDIRFMFSYAYYLKFPWATLSMGLQVGGKYSNFNYGKLNIKDSDDRIVAEGSDKVFLPDANLGLYLYGENFYLGASTKQLINSRYGLVEKDGVTIYSKLDRHYYFMGGYVFPLTADIMCRPSTLVKYVNNTDPQIDLNISFLLANVIWLGTSYRTGDQVAMMAELNVSDKLSLGYSFDMPLTQFGTYTHGTHEIILSYNLSLYRERRMSPRYF